jgi:hypothetical protein
MDLPDWVPRGINTERPSVARLYDYALGGAHNFAADRTLFDHLVTLMPDVASVAQAKPRVRAPRCAFPARRGRPAIP